MVKPFSKPPAARQLEARARARQLGVKVEVVSEARHYRTRAQSTPGEQYAIVRTPVGWACSCLGYFHTGICKHLGQVERRAEREGWAFGTIAPLSQVARYFPLTDPDPDPEPEPTPPPGRARSRSPMRTPTSWPRSRRPNGTAGAATTRPAPPWRGSGRRRWPTGTARTSAGGASGGDPPAPATGGGNAP